MPSAKKFTTIDEYISGFEPDIQKRLQQVRSTAKKAAPRAVEAIKWNMPTLVDGGNVALFAAFKNHIGFFPVPTRNPEFKKDFAAYKTGRGSIQFPYADPLPLKLITKLVKYQLKKNKEKAVAKKGTPKKSKLRR